MIRRTVRVSILATTILVVGVFGAGAALACGGLIAPGHAEVLEKAVTLAAWHDGVEHYVTGFQFAGDANSFGYIIPLPGAPSSIVKGGNWTLERLQGEIGEGPLAPQKRGLFAPEASAGAAVTVLQQVKIDALNITVVRGGGPDVVQWAKANGFDVTPDTPAVMKGYSDAGAIFALARFDRADARIKGIIEGQGEVIQFVIPTPAPWIPLRILALGKAPQEFVDAELFVLTDGQPTFYPRIPGITGMSVRANEPASAALLKDLAKDRAMAWLPTSGMWFTALNLHTTAAKVTEDLSIDHGGPAPTPIGAPIPLSLGWPFWIALVGGSLAVFGIARREQRRSRMPAVVA